MSDRNQSRGSDDEISRRRVLYAAAGDIVFVRNGAGSENTYRLASGLHAACLPWLRERRVAVLSSDSDNDVHPALPDFEKWNEPMHMVGIVYLGLTLLDQSELDGLAAACAEENRWEFFRISGQPAGDLLGPDLTPFSASVRVRCPTRRDFPTNAHTRRQSSVG